MPAGLWVGRSRLACRLASIVAGWAAAAFPAGPMTADDGLTRSPGSSSRSSEGQVQAAGAAGSDRWLGQHPRQSGGRRPGAHRASKSFRLIPGLRSPRPGSRRDGRSAALHCHRPRAEGNRSCRCDSHRAIKTQHVAPPSTAEGHLVMRTRRPRRGLRMKGVDRGPLARDNCQVPRRMIAYRLFGPLAGSLPRSCSPASG